MFKYQKGKTYMSYHWWLTTAKNPSWCCADNIFSDEEIEYIKNAGADVSLSTLAVAKVGSKISDDTEVDASIRKSKISWIKADVQSNQWIFRKLTDILQQINNDVFNFDLDCIQNLQFTEYSEGEYYKAHTDLMYESDRTRKLSFTIQLTEPAMYEGGDVKLLCGKSFSVPKTKASITVFPSYVLHEVEPVKKGVRHALVGWVIGPKFR
jgi:PKHD-type hydroxylase